MRFGFVADVAANEPIEVDLGGGGSVANVTATFSKWDEDVSIEAPPADQVQR